MEPEDRHSKSYFLFLTCTFMYLKIPINNLFGKDTEDRYYNQNQEPSPTGNISLTLTLRGLNFHKKMYTTIYCAFINLKCKANTFA